MKHIAEDKLESLTGSQRFRLRKAGYDIPKRRPGPPLGYVEFKYKMAWHRSLEVTLPMIAPSPSQRSA